MYQEGLKLIKEKGFNESQKKKLELELEKINNRTYTTGFLFDKVHLGEIEQRDNQKRIWEYIGLVCDKNNTIIVKNKIKVNDQVEILTPKGINQDKIRLIFDLEKNALTEINPGSKDQKAVLKLTKIYPKNSVIRKKV